MDTLYWVMLLVGGTLVALSLLGGHDADAGDADLGHDLGGHDAGGSEAGAHAATLVDGGTDTGSYGGGPGGVVFSDVLSLRFFFLFAAFFGLTGLVMGHVAGVVEPLAGVMALCVGVFVGLFGNVFIRRVGQAEVSSSVGTADLHGKTARVVLPFGGDERGTVTLLARGQRYVLTARAFGGVERYRQGEDVVVVRLDGRVAEVLRVGGPLDAEEALPLAAPPARLVRA